MDRAVSAFPPFLLLARTLVKIQADGVGEVIVIAPSWLRRSWYILLLQMACKLPCLLPLNMDLMMMMMMILVLIKGISSGSSMRCTIL